MPLDALAHEINAASVRVIDGFEMIVLRPRPVFELRKRMRAGPLKVQRAGREHQRVANRFGVEPASVHSPEQITRGIKRERLLS